MNGQTARFGIVGLGEAGNLGDDLILIATIDAIYEAEQESEIKFLSFGQELDWSRLAVERSYPDIPQRVLAKPEIPLLRQNSNLYKHCDVIIFGGGGLLQTSHDRNRPYNWLSYLPNLGKDTPRVLATGLGLGPLAPVWIQRLRQMGTPFDSAWLRDEDSLKLSRDVLGWPGEECRDFIDREFLSSLLVARPENQPVTRRLGIALRDWPNFTIDDGVKFIESVIRRHECEDIVFFVLESNNGLGRDVVFSEQIARRLSRPSRIRAYIAGELNEFLEDMSTIDIAISMKLHSSAIWGTLAVPMYPIFYAPKVAALFGKKFRGFEMVDEMLQIVDQAPHIPRSHQVVADGIRNLRSKHKVEGSRFSLLAKYRYQSAHLMSAITSRVKTKMTKNKKVSE